MPFYIYIKYFTGIYSQCSSSYSCTYDLEAVVKVEELSCDDNNNGNGVAEDSETSEPILLGKLAILDRISSNHRQFISVKKSKN